MEMIFEFHGRSYVLRGILEGSLHSISLFGGKGRVIKEHDMIQEECDTC